MAEPTRAWLLLLLLPGALAACRYQASRGVETSRDESCRPHCAAIHARCVEQGQAKLFGLPGVTLDLCRRELERCLAGCARDGDLAPPPPLSH